MRVYTCLIGDLFHPGHVNFLKQAKNEGSYLIVGVCSDEDCEKYKRKPIMNFTERLAIIESCRYVDEIIKSPSSIISQEFIDKYNIDLIVHGDDSNTEQLIHFYEVAIRQNKYKSLNYTSGISTSEIIERIRNRSQKSLTRNQFLC